jgi:hypothetical protein
MNLFTTLLAFFHCSDFRNSRFVKWLVGDEEPKPGSCACKGKWDKFKETEHGPKYCSRSTHKNAYEA